MKFKFFLFVLYSFRKKPINYICEHFPQEILKTSDNSMFPLCLIHAGCSNPAGPLPEVLQLCKGNLFPIKPNKI